MNVWVWVWLDFLTVLANEIAWLDNGECIVLNALTAEGQWLDLWGTGGRLGGDGQRLCVNLGKW